jgi:hypothetical protein
MNEGNDTLCLTFEAMAKTCPQDDGVRLTADLAIWLQEEHQRRQLPVPPIVNKIIHAVSRSVDSEFGHGVHP